MANLTDYDVWHTREEPVTVDMVMTTMRRNLEIAQMAVASAIETLDESATCTCHKALENATMTERSAIPQATLEKLRPLVGQYFKD